MRILTRALLGMVPVVLLGASAATAAPNWKQNCYGPAHACATTAPAIAPKAKTATVKKAKPATAAAEAPVKKAKKHTTKKSAASLAGDDTPVKLKKKKIATSKHKKVVAKHDDRDDTPVKKHGKKQISDGGGSAYQSGVASWYGGSFHGRKTANGETYDMWSLTAAHRSLPFGTRVRVTNTSNGDSVVVRINDRGPFVGGRVIDLSRAAADEIGMDGLAHVKLTVLARG